MTPPSSKKSGKRKDSARKTKRLPRNRRAPTPPRTIVEIRSKLDDPQFSQELQELPLDPCVQLTFLKDKIAEALPKLVNQPPEFQREQLLRDQCAREAAILRQAHFLENEERTRPLWLQIEAEAQLREQRSEGVESYSAIQIYPEFKGLAGPGSIRMLRHLPSRYADWKHSYDHAVLELFGILRRFSQPDSARETLFGIIVKILQAVGVLPKDEADHVEAIRRRFDRANVRFHGGFPYVDFLEDCLFGDDPRFPPRPLRMPPQNRFTSTPDGPPVVINPPDTKPDP
jgi:hypothetical protein